MPSTQTPPIAGRQSIRRAFARPSTTRVIERVEPAELHARLEELEAERLHDAAGLGRGGLSAARAALRRRLSSFEATGHGRDRRGSRNAGPDARPLRRPRRASAAADASGDLWTVGGLGRARNLRSVRHRLRRAPGSAAHSDARRLGGPSAAQRLPAARARARERSPRPPFALKSNVQAGTPPIGTHARGAARADRRVAKRALRRDAVGHAAHAGDRQPRRQCDGAVDGAAASFDARRAADHARDRRRDRRQGRARDRLPAHRHRKDRRESLLVAGADRYRAHGLSRARVQRALLRARRRETARHHRPHSRSARKRSACSSPSSTRIASHCVWLGTHGIDLGAISVFFYAFDLRENILDLQEAAGGARMHPNYMRVGGVNGDLPAGFLPSSTS